MNPITSGNNRNSFRKVVVVLGAPRGGTSVTAGLLSVLGVDMGNLRGSTPKNPKGLFEDRDFLALIREIIIAADPELNKPDAVVGLNPPTVEKVLSQKANFNGRIQQFINERDGAATCPVWGWKVITTNIAIELFLPYLTNPHFVVVFRNPLDIGKSLVEYTKKNQKLTLIKALKLCNYYYQSIFNFLDSHPGLPVLFVTFADIVANPSKEAERMADFLNIEFAAKHAYRAEQFVIPRNKIELAKRKMRVKQMAHKRLFRIVRKIIT